jgi:hypothetical protein
VKGSRCESGADATVTGMPPPRPWAQTTSPEMAGRRCGRVGREPGDLPPAKPQASWKGVGSQRLSSSITSGGGRARARRFAPCVPALATGPAQVTVRRGFDGNARRAGRGICSPSQPVSATATPNTHAATKKRPRGARAQRRNWSGTYFGFHGFSSKASPARATRSEAGAWDIWLNHQESPVGLCEAERKRCGAAVPVRKRDFCPTPLDRSPGTGEAVTVRVIGYSAPGTGAPVAGASLSGGASTVAGADGRAVGGPDGRLTDAARGRAGRSAMVGVCVRNGNDGLRDERPTATGTRPWKSAQRTLPAPAYGPYTGSEPPAACRRGTPTRFLGKGCCGDDPVAQRHLGTSEGTSTRRCSPEAVRDASCVRALRRALLHGLQRRELLLHAAEAPGPGRYVLDVQALGVAGTRRCAEQLADRLLRWKAQAAALLVGAGLLAGWTTPSPSRGAPTGLRGCRAIVGGHESPLCARHPGGTATWGGYGCAVAAGPLAVLAAAAPRAAFARCATSPLRRLAWQLGVVRERPAGAQRRPKRLGLQGRRPGRAGAADQSGPRGGGRRVPAVRVLWFYCKTAARGCQRADRHPCRERPPDPRCG